MTDLQQTLDTLYRTESRRILATLIRLLGDFDMAEDALHDAFRAAMEQWPTDGVPSNPRAWLVSTGRFKAIDKLRRQSRINTPLDEGTELMTSLQEDPAHQNEQSVNDDQLRLIFTCCHPALAPEARTAFALREVCGLMTEEIARAFLIPPTTLAQRIVRAKNKIREAKIPYEVPSASELPERLNTVLKVIYLVYNEGYSASTGIDLTRVDLSQEAIRLGRLLVALLPESECHGLLALMLLHESRRHARTTAEGDLILLEDQDRSMWNQALIGEGTEFVKKAFAAPPVGPYTIQAAISGLHAQAPSLEKTDWPQVISLYEVLLKIEPSPVIQLNHAVAVAMHKGPSAGLALMDEINKTGALGDYQWFHSARAELFRRLGQVREAEVAYRKALTITQLEPEKKFLKKRLEQLSK